ncbi:MAG: malonate transporter subunit MadL [Phascolarctobacterium sp.]|uniref:malonate transporter subunit MadL n=1 Tax=Phascolarctobacterium sp. TaxID=2049039 RepID=UPI0026DA89AC|nr:malonate transporter subunit MadL [Phascolarctobacterium sp.]MDO4921083.1 malonate transporter subunit MadL [Phascolarctobacterium sp.]
MIIKGVALLAACFLSGLYIGDILGPLLGVKANVGGVGFAMLFLILLTNHGTKYGWLDSKSASGIDFWAAMYIPIVVAMTASQDVVAAVTSGPLAIIGGVLGVLAGFALIPILAKL